MDSDLKVVLSYTNLLGLTIIFFPYFNTEVLNVGGTEQQPQYLSQHK